MSSSKNAVSTYALMICYGIMIWTAFVFYPRWEKGGTEATLSWDVSGYYMYLPALFIYQDIKHCGFQESIIKQYGPSPTFDQAFKHGESGNLVMKYSAGQACVMLPFFVIGHLWASNSAIYPADGFSFPYQLSIGVGMFLIALIGLFFLRRILLVYFKDSTTAIVLLLLVMGTNYLNYTCIDQAMTHNVLFTIYTILIWLCIRFYKRHKFSYALLIGMLCGFATLTRPTEIIALSIPILWGVVTWSDLKNRIHYLFTDYKKILLAVFAFIAIVFIQLVYWRYVTGNWLVYSYQEQGFSWLHPHLKNYLFSYKSGWLRYCPMMALPFIGLLLMLRSGANRFAIILYTAISLYITSAWDLWDYGGTAGRAMVQHYVVLAFPLAVLIAFIQQKKWLMFIFYPTVHLFCYLNIWWVYQAHIGGADVALATKEYYWKVVGRWHIDEDVNKLLDNPHRFEGTPKAPDLLCKQFSPNDTIKSITLDAEHQHAVGAKFNSSRHNWIRAFATFESAEKEWNIWSQCQFIIAFYNSDKLVQTNFIRVFRFLNSDEIKTIYLDARPPKEWSNAEIQFWNAGSDKKITIRNIRVIGFDQ